MTRSAQRALKLKEWLLIQRRICASVLRNNGCFRMDLSHAMVRIIPALNLNIQTVLKAVQHAATSGNAILSKNVHILGRFFPKMEHAHGLVRQVQRYPIPMEYVKRAQMRIAVFVNISKVNRMIRNVSCARMDFTWICQLSSV